MVQGQPISPSCCKGEEERKCGGFPNVCVLLLFARSRVKGRRKRRTSQVLWFSRTISRGALWPFVDVSKTEVSRPKSGHLIPHIWWSAANANPRTRDSSLTVPPSDGQRGESNKAAHCYSNTTLYLGLGTAKSKHKLPNITRFQENAITRKHAPKKMAMGVI